MVPPFTASVTTLFARITKAFCEFICYSSFIYHDSYHIELVRLLCKTTLHDSVIYSVEK